MEHYQREYINCSKNEKFLTAGITYGLILKILIVNLVNAFRFTICLE